MILSDKYKKAMDNISLTDEQKQKIVLNAKKKEKFNYRAIVNVAACLAVVAVAYGVLQNRFEPNSPDKYPDDSVIVATTEMNSETTTVYIEKTEADTEPTTNKKTEKITEATTVKNVAKKAVQTKKAEDKPIVAYTEAETEFNQEKIYMSDTTEDMEQSIYNEEMPKLAGSPYMDYSSVDELKKNISIDAKMPDKIGNYEAYSYSIVFSDMVEIRYSCGSDNIIYRAEKGENQDISGDYNSYNNIRKIIAADIDVTIKGNGEEYNTAIWYKNGINYSLSSENGLHEENIINIIKEIM